MTTITALFKNKGKRKEFKNYRGLSLGSTLLKLAMAIILVRIRPWYNKQLLLNQNGFCEHFGCHDAIFSLKSIQNTASKMNKEVIVLFIDLTAAYDWCVQKWICHTIFNRIDSSNEDVDFVYLGSVISYSEPCTCMCSFLLYSLIGPIDRFFFCIVITLFTSALRCYFLWSNTGMIIEQRPDP